MVKPPIGTVWSELSNTEQGKYKEILNEYITIQLCHRNIHILNKWNALHGDNQRRLLCHGAHEPIPSFEMSPEDVQKAWPKRSSWGVPIVSRPFSGFDPNDHVAMYSLVVAPNLEAIH